VCVCVCVVISCRMEAIVVTDGEATVTSSTMPGKDIVLKPGMVAYFPKGLKANWNVQRYGGA
jgi:uncharacterized cupin superfamily protein